MQYELSKLPLSLRRYAVAVWSLALATLISTTFVHFYGWHRGVVFPYLFAILACLPYVVQAEVQHIRGGNTSPGHALFFRHGAVSQPVASDDARQLALWR